MNLTRRHDAGRTRGITCRENLSKKTYEDDNPVVLTAYQAAKCAASVSAALAGDPAWTELAQKVGAFFDVSAAEAKGELIRPTAAYRPRRDHENAASCSLQRAAGCRSAQHQTADRSGAYLPKAGRRHGPLITSSITSLRVDLDKSWSMMRAATRPWLSRTHVVGMAVVGRDFVNDRSSAPS